MYYIVNHTGHILAADESLLQSLSVENIDDLYTNIALGNIAFGTVSEDALNITVSGEHQSYRATQHKLAGILGEMTLIEVVESSEKAVETETETEIEEDLIGYKDEISIIDDAPITFGGSDEPADEPEKEEAPISIMEEEKPFDLISDDTPTMLKEVEEAEEAPKASALPETDTAMDDSPIYIDVKNISQKIGISEEDYNEFLNEYIDTALTLEEDLKSDQEKKRTHAITTLAHLSNVLHLSLITDIVNDIQASISESDNHHIQKLYHTLARLTTSKETASDEVAISPITPEPEPEVIQSERAPSEPTEGFGTIDLSDVKPIHFDFQLEEAANDLSLPVELIEEFVIDFIEQAHTETKKMLEAYERGDLSTIQKIGHLLKGTSSNLRINPLSDTLYEIQFCEDSSKLEPLIKEYWGHFLSFEHQINIKLN